jgi:hypothetical protein
MKNAPAFVLVLLSLCLTAVKTDAQTNSLAALGSSNFVIDEGSTTIAYTQSSTNLTLANTIALGDTLGGVFSSAYNWSAFADTNNFTFGLFISAPGASPNVGFTIEFFNGALDGIVNAYQGSASGLSTTPTFVPVELSAAGTGDFSSIGGMQFSWDSPGSGTVVLESVAVAVVPEPSTWAMLILGGLVAGGAALRRRLAVVRR